MVNWADTLYSPVEAIEHGISESDAFFESTHTGPITFDRIDYPAAQVAVEDLSRMDATNWQHSIQVNLYFEWSRGLDFDEDVVHPISAVLGNCLEALSGVSCITNYHPETIDFFSGEPQNSLILAVSIRFRAQTLIDPAEF